VLYTGEDGPAAEGRTLAVSRCPEHGHYSTVYDDDIIAHKHYGLREIQGVLDGTDTTSLACRRSHYNWRKWHEGIWTAVVDRIQGHINKIFSKARVSEALWAYCRSLGDGWLRYVLDLFHANVEDLCTCILLVCPIMGLGGERAHEGRVLHGVPGPAGGQRPP
jgi:hypothetical protein